MNDIRDEGTMERAGTWTKEKDRDGVEITSPISCVQEKRPLFLWNWR